MNRKAVLALLLSFALAAFASAQITTPHAAASAQTNTKLAKLDLLIKLVPLALQKDQYSFLLTGIENARQVERDTLKSEDADLATLDPLLSETVQNAVEKGIYPPRTIQEQVAASLNAMRDRRTLENVKMINAVWDQIKLKLNDGQIKAMAGGFSDEFVSPTAKPGELTQDVKVRFFIDRVFLDTLTYDLLLDMSKHAS
jgi:hypothetical protein